MVTAISSRLSRLLPVRYLPRCRDVSKKTVWDPDIRARAG